MTGWAVGAIGITGGWTPVIGGIIDGGIIDGGCCKTMGEGGRRELLL